ncbi:MAG: hypothetical protein GXO90_10580 [FCB group bacterium]|nr:hypothetical protein [FCB group bacterium]
MTEPNPNYLICPQCNYFCHAVEDACFCPSCGHELERYCRQCRKPIDNPYANYCKYCGATYPGRPRNSSEEKKQNRCF